MRKGWLKSRFRYFFFLLLLIFSLWWYGYSRPSPKPGMGSINGVRLEIPAAYMFFPVEYEGDEIWERPPRRHAPGPDVPIRSFSLLIHFPDFSPLNSENRDSWNGRRGDAAKANEWIVVGVKPIRDLGTDEHAWFDRFIAGRMDAQISWRSKHDWYFERQPDLVHGLINEKKIGPDYTKISVDNSEIFYDQDRSKSFIDCGSGAGGIKFCTQAFVVEEFKILVDASYAKNNLKDWRQIQSEVTRIVLSLNRR
jgi:hypothetical protein